MNLRDFLKLYTEISSLNWIFHQNRPAAGSRLSFLENRWSYIVRKWKPKGRARTENCSRKAKFDENLIYRHFN